MPRACAAEFAQPLILLLIACMHYAVCLSVCQLLAPVALVVAAVLVPMLQLPVFGVQSVYYIHKRSGVVMAKVGM